MLQPSAKPAAISPLATIIRKERLLPKEVAHTVIQLANDAVEKDPRIHTWVRQKLAQMISGQEGRDKLPFAMLSAANILLATSREVYRYVEDPERVELIYHPSRAMDQIMQHGAFSGDCDDATAFLLACLRSVGLKSRVKLVSLHTAAPERYSHIFPEIWISNAWIAVDSTLSDADALAMVDRIVDTTAYIVE